MPSAFAARLALIVGNDTYKNVASLRNARADASAVASALRSFGFKVTLIHDSNERGFRAELRTFKETVSEGDDVVFFFSGHGVQLGTANYLLPVDIRGESEDQVKDEAIPLQRVLDDLADKKARFSLMIIDACRDNPFRGRGRALGGRGLAPTTAATGQMIIYSAGSGQQALDQLSATDTNPNGLFSRVFLKEIDKVGQPVDRVLRNVREEVVRLGRSVGHEQVPALYDQSLGDFFFRQSGDSASNLKPSATVSPAQPIATQPAGKPADIKQPAIAFAVFDGDPITSIGVVRIVNSDLGRSGRFRFVESGGTVMSENQRPDVTPWVRRGADYLVGGSTAKLPDGRTDVRFRAWDLKTASDLGGQSFNVGPEDLRLSAHRISDWLQKKITGVPGNYSRRVAKVVSEEGRFRLFVSDSDGANPQSALSSPKPIALPIWSPSGSELAYLSFESGQPEFYVHQVASGKRARNADASKLVVAACTFELGALQSGTESLRGDWLKDDWDSTLSTGCRSKMMAALGENKF